MMMKRATHVSVPVGPSLFAAAVACAALLAATPAMAHDTLSNRHHLNCTQAGELVVIPHTTHTTGRPYLPADLGGGAQVQAIYGDEGRTRIGINRGGVVVQERSGGVVMSSAQQQQAC